MAFKLTKEMVDATNTLLPVASHRWATAGHIRGNTIRLIHQHANLAVRRSFFTCRVVQPWNSLSLNTVGIRTIETFKRYL